MQTNYTLLQNTGLLWLRVFMGCGIAYHGFGKFAKIDKFAEGIAVMGFPSPELFAWAATLSEFAGGLCIVFGLFTRPAALFVFTTMSVAAFIRHGDDPFKGKELALAYWTMAGTVLAMGAGKFSLDYLSQNEKTKERKN